MLKHTPGPWWNDGLEVLNDPIGSVKVAKVSGANYEEAKANARLIAQTPRILTALRTLLKESEKSGVSNLYENLKGNPHMKPTAMGAALGEVRVILAAIDEANEEDDPRTERCGECGDAIGDEEMAVYGGRCKDCGNPSEDHSDEHPCPNPPIPHHLQERD